VFRVFDNGNRLVYPKGHQDTWRVVGAPYMQEDDGYHACEVEVVKNV
jgi:hypothetical protein